MIFIFCLYVYAYMAEGRQKMWVHGFRAEGRDEPDRGSAGRALLDYRTSGTLGSLFSFLQPKSSTRFSHLQRIAGLSCGETCHRSSRQKIFCVRGGEAGLGWREWGVL